MNGSYKQKMAPEIWTAGWVIHCTVTNRNISATLIEKSDSASSYRGELLGMLAIHLFLYTIEEFYEVTDSNNILCNIKGALYTFEWKSKRIPAVAKNNKVQQVLRYARSKIKSLHLLHHVKAPQGDYKKWSDLPLEAQLNCHCDDLEKIRGCRWDNAWGQRTPEAPSRICVFFSLVTTSKQ